MAIQTTYTTDPGVAFEGQLADNTLVKETISRAVAAGGTVPAGRLVVRATSDTTVRLPTAAGDLAAAQGVSMYNASKIPGDYGAPLWNGQTFLPTLPVLRKGRIWVRVEEAVAQGGPVFVRFAAGAGGANLGAFRTSADTGTAAQLGTGTNQAQYATSAAAGALAQVELNLP